jgi:hypothetical protein
VSFVPFVPSASSVFLAGVAASSLVPVAGVGFSGGVLLGSSWVARGFGGPRWVGVASASLADGFAVWFAGSSVPLVCLSAALPPSAFESLRSSAASAGASAASVFPVVAVGAGGRAAPGFFCGLAASGPVAASPVVGSFV